MLGERIQDRAITLNGGGWAGGDAHRAKISICSSFVLTLRASGRVVIAGLLATVLVAGEMVGHLPLRVSGSFDHLVSAPPKGRVDRVPDGEDNGSGPASQGAEASGSQSQNAPGERNPGTWGLQR
jgi:hypothetical protein